MVVLSPSQHPHSMHTLMHMPVYQYALYTQHSAYLITVFTDFIQTAELKIIIVLIKML